MTVDEQMRWVERMLYLADETLNELDFNPDNQSEFERRVLVNAARRQLDLLGPIYDELASQVSDAPGHERLADIRHQAEQLRQLLESIPVPPPEAAHPTLVPQSQTDMLGPVAQTPDVLAQRLQETLRAQQFNAFDQAAVELADRQHEYPPTLGVLGLVTQTLDVVEAQVNEAVQAGDQSGLEQALHELERMEHEYPLRSDHITKLLALKNGIQEALRTLPGGSAMASVDDLNTQTPGYGPVKRGQVPELSGTSAIKVPALPGTSAVQVPGLPGTTQTRLGDNGVLHAQATPEQKATRRLPVNLDEFLATQEENARRLMPIALGATALFRFAPELLAAVVARGGLGNWLRQPQPVPVRVPTVPPR